MINREAFDKYRNRYQVVNVFVEGKESYISQLKDKLCFSSLQDIGAVGDDPMGDNVLVLEEWGYCADDYDDILNRWPYPKEAHKFPKGWVEARRLCIAVESDDRPCIIYINRDAYSDGLVMARVEK